MRWPSVKVWANESYSRWCCGGSFPSDCDDLWKNDPRLDRRSTLFTPVDRGSSCGHTGEYANREAILVPSIKETSVVSPALGKLERSNSIPKYKTGQLQN
jgi:hypothetical protein